MLEDLWGSSGDYDELTDKLHPKSKIQEVQNV